MTTRTLWIVQFLLAATFLFAGAAKLFTPLDQLTQQLPLPGLFVRFLGLAETLGALGLVLPGLLRIGTGLVPLAAAGLVLIMAGATLLTPTLLGFPLVWALLPLVLGALAAYVAYGRARLAPLQPRQAAAAAATAAQQGFGGA